MSTAESVQPILTEKSKPQYDAQEMVSLIAHELRQPLSTMESLSCYLEIVLPPHETKAHLQVAKMQELLRQANWILSDAVHFLQAARVHPVLMDWNETVMEIVSEGGATPGETIEFTLDDSIPPILFDLDQAWHLAMGVYLFLRKLSRNKSQVKVSSRLLPGLVELEFAAAAPEANPDCCESLFEPFSSHCPAGSGLAMASAKRIVQSHGGTIEVQTRPEDLVVIAMRFPIQACSQAHITEST